jgi:hypothetical protein
MDGLGAVSYPDRVFNAAERGDILLEGFDVWPEDKVARIDDGRDRPVDIAPYFRVLLLIGKERDCQGFELLLAAFE